MKKIGLGIPKSSTVVIPKPTSRKPGISANDITRVAQRQRHPDPGSEFKVGNIMPGDSGEVIDASVFLKS